VYTRALRLSIEVDDEAERTVEGNRKVWFSIKRKRPIRKLEGALRNALRKNLPRHNIKLFFNDKEIDPTDLIAEHDIKQDDNIVARFLLK
jgi:hypothetical protein